MNAEIVQEVIRLATIFTDEKRIKILESIRQHPSLTVGEIAIKIGMSHSSTSRQLKLFRIERLVSTRREGQHIFYSANNQTKFLLQILDMLYKNEEKENN